MKPGELNEKTKKFNINDRLHSFSYAFSGVACLFRYEHNARIHLFVFIVVLLAGIILRISSSGWVAIFFASGLVFISECFNTAIESLSDVVSPEYNEKIKNAKDVAAAGVLISAIISVIIGLFVFIPAISSLISR
jgi:diacylglycerol kinase (ATP)